MQWTGRFLIPLGGTFNSDGGNRGDGVLRR